MIVEETRDIGKVLELIPFEMEIRNKDRESMPLKDAINIIDKKLKGSPLFKIFLAYETDDKNKIAGYCFTEITPPPGPKKLLLYRMYAPKKDIRIALDKAKNEWANQFKINTEHITTNKHIRALKRLYKFKVVSVNMERRI